MTREHGRDPFGHLCLSGAHGLLLANPNVAAVQKVAGDLLAQPDRPGGAEAGHRPAVQQGTAR